MRGASALGPQITLAYALRLKSWRMGHIRIKYENFNTKNKTDFAFFQARKKADAVPQQY